MKNVIAAIFGIICVLLVSVNARARVYTIVSLEYPPYGYLENGTASGCDVEIVQEAFRRMGKQVAFEFFPWRRALEMARHKAVDGMFMLLKTPQRCEYMCYSEPLRSEAISLFVTRDSDVRFNGDLSVLREHSLGVLNGFSYGPRLDRFIWDNRKKSVDAADSVLTNVYKLLKNRFEIFLSDDLSTFYTARRAGLLDGLKRLIPAAGYNPIYVSFCKLKGAEKLRDEFNDALKSMKDDGTWKAMIEKYQIRYANDFPGEKFVLDKLMK